MKLYFVLDCFRSLYKKKTYRTYYWGDILCIGTYIYYGNRFISVMIEIFFFVIFYKKICWGTIKMQLLQYRVNFVVLLLCILIWKYYFQLFYNFWVYMLYQFLYIYNQLLQVSAIEKQDEAHTRLSETATNSGLASILVSLRYLVQIKCLHKSYNERGNRLNRQ